MTFKIETAKREKTNTLTALVGPSGSGKTYSSILLARGLVGQDGKIGFLDTENRRALHYASLAGGFDHADFAPPFTSNRYIEAIDAFESAGFHCLIIDSVSHQWDGEGGILELADEIELQTKKSGLHCWKKPKALHKKFVQRLLQSRMHLILNFRAKDKVKQVRVGGRTEIINEGLIPITDQRLLYEMTAAVMLSPEDHTLTHIKVGSELAGAFPEGSLIGFETGQALRKWSEEGVAVDQERELFAEQARTIARGGLDNLTEWSKTLDKTEKAIVAELKEELGSIARAADEAKAAIEQVEAEPGDKVMELANG